MIQVHKNRALKKEIVLIVFCYQYSSFKLKFEKITYKYDFGLLISRLYRRL